ncbi:MAG: UvrD-helicase domain-containing protein [Candidatus Berkiellales bacterium]
MSDDAIRSMALDPTRSFIVQAPAGSGKTELLTQRFLKLLATQQSPEEILAVTFTRKAASEMRQRIMQALQSATKTSASELPHEQATWSLAKAVLEQDQKCQWDLLQNPNRLRIVTIDALCIYIVSRMPLLSNLGGTPEILEFPFTVYRQAVKLFFKETTLKEEWSEALCQLLEHLDNRIEMIAQMMINLLSKRDQWLPYLSKMQQTPFGLEQYLNDCFTSIINEHLKQLRSQFSTEDAGQLITLLQYAAANSEELKHGMDLAMLPQSEAKDYSHWLAIANLLTTKSDRWRQALNQNHGFPSPSSAKNKAEKERRQSHKEEMLALIDKFAKDELLLKLLSDLKLLPPAQLSQNHLTILQALGKLLPVLVAFLQMVFQEQGKIDFPEVTLRALTALGDELNPSDIALHLDYKINHILIDEYQDTSVPQYRLFEKCVMGWQEGDGRTLFLVGDPMQSIYRFRGAEVSLFLHTKVYGLGGIKLTPLHLTVNFRTIPEIVEWVNSAFTHIFPKQSDLSLGGVTYSAAISAKTSTNDQAVHVHHLLKENRELGSVVSQLVCESLKKNPQGSIAVLVRAKKHLTEIIQQLKRLDIPFVAHEVDHLADRPHVMDLVSLLYAAEDLTDKVSWYAVLRAPWLGLSLADLVILAKHNRSGNLWNSLLQFGSLEGLSTDGFERLKRFVMILEYWLNERYRDQLCHWLRGLWVALGGPACYQDPHFLTDIDKVLNLIELNERGGRLVDREEFAFKLASLTADIAPESDQTPVELMTIHKAKGLEFDTVIMPHLQSKTRSHENALLLWFERSHAEGIDLILSPRRAVKDENDPLSRYVAKQIQKKHDFEAARLLYVGVTRARSTLHLISEYEAEYENEGTPDKQVIKTPSNGSFMSMLWPHLPSPDLVTQVSLANMGQSGSRSENQNGIKRLPLNWQLPEIINEKVYQNCQQNSKKSFDLNRPERDDPLFRCAGTVFHRLLQHYVIHGSFPAKMNEVAKLLLRRMGIGEDLAKAIALIEQGINNMLSDPKGQWILDPTHRERQAEWQLSAGAENDMANCVKTVENVVIDYAFTDNSGVRWIVDYKLSQTAWNEELFQLEIERYRPQILKYQRILTAFENRPVRGGLYFPLAQKWWELTS